MKDKIKLFIERNIKSLDANDFDGFYEEANLTFDDYREMCDLTETLLEAGINPLEHLDYVPEGYLYNNQDILKLEIPSNIKRIEQKAFCFNANIRELTIPASVSYIDYNAFCGCTNLSTIYIDSKLMEIEREAFDQCYNLNEIIFRGTIEEWHSLMDDNFCSELENCTLISCTDGDIDND